MLERIPPHNLEAEQSLLGALLVDKEGMLRIADTVRTEDFYRQAHGDIFQAMIDLYAKREPVDLLSLSNRLNEKHQLEAIGGRAYLIELTTIVPTAAPSSPRKHHSKRTSVTCRPLPPKLPALLLTKAKKTTH